MREFTILYSRIILVVLSLFVCNVASAQDKNNDCPTEKKLALKVGSGSGDILCDLPGILDFEITGYDDKANRGATYYISYGDGEYINTIDIGEESAFAYKTVLTNEELKQKNGKLSYTFKKSYCEVGKDIWKVEVWVIGCNPEYKKYGATSLQLQKKGTVDFQPEPLCNYEVCFHNKSKGFIDVICDTVRYYKWDLGDNTIITQFDDNPDLTVCHKYNCAGEYNIKLYAFSDILDEENGDDCGSDSLTKQVKFLPTPELKKFGPIKVCKGTKIDKVVLPDLDVCEYEWFDPDTKTCKKTDVCALLGKKVAHRFEVVVSGDNVGLPIYGTYTNLTEIPEFTAKNEDNVEKRAKICITPYNEDGCAGQPMCYDIIVSPSAKLIDPKNYKFCDKEQTNIENFKATISGVNFEWKVKDGDWEAIGMPAASGTGYMSNFTAKNTTKEPITVTIEVKGNSPTCDGDVTEFTITTYPYPEYTITYGNPTTCNGTEGWIKFEGLDLNTTKYSIQYDKNGNSYSEDFTTTNGTYTLSGLTKGEYTKIQIAGKGFGCYTTTADITLVDPPLPNAPVISSNSPVCIGTNLELKVESADSDITTWKWTGPSCTSGGAVPSTLEEPTPKPMQYCMAGDYTLAVGRNNCFASSTISVAYREDPEVTLLPLNSVCVGSSFKINDKVTFNWKTIPKADWKIKWEIIDNQGNVVSTQNDIENPQFIINQVGDYKIKVSVEGFGCNGTKLEAEQSIKVKQVNYTLDVKVDKTQICANDNVVFTNNTTKNDEVKYNWTVSPETGVSFKNGTNKTSEAPEILFQDPGKYTVTVVADNVCTQRTQTFNINVRKNPTVVLNKLPDICSGEAFTEVNNYVTYAWNNVEGETPVWSATPADGVEFSDSNSNFPTIKYTKPGDYTIKVEMPDISCGIKSYAESNVKVYDGSFTVDITQDKTTICEGEQIGFVNNTVSTDPIEYKWTVSPTDGVVISDDKNPTPKITFNKFGEFVISVLIDGVCQDETKTFNLRVNKDPEVSFNPLGFTCTSKTFPLTSDLVNYVWNSVKDTEKKVIWSVLDDNGAAVASSAYTIDDVNALYPIFTFTTAGTYTLKVELDDLGCNGTKTKAESSIVVYDNTFVLDIKQDETVICENQKVTFTNNTTSSDPLTYTWTVLSMDGVTISDANSPAPSITFTRYGDFEISVAIDGKCSEQTKTFNVLVRKDPEVEIADLDSTCTNIPFELTEELVKYEWYNVPDVDKTISWSITSANSATATFTDSSIANPTVTFTEAGEYTLEVEITNYNCGGTKTKTTKKIIVVEADYKLDVKNQDVIICYEESVDIVNNTDDNQGVSYTWSVANGDGEETSGWSFENGGEKSKTPKFKFASPGNYVVTVSAKNICTTKTHSFNVRVNKDPEISFAPLETICNNNKFTFDNAKVIYEWYNMLDSEKEIEWTVTPNTGVMAEDTDKEYPSFTFSEIGNYTVKVKAKATGCSQSYIEESVNITVISDNLDLQVDVDKREGCVPLDITFTNNTSDTDEIEYKWSVDKPESQWSYKKGDESSKVPIFTFNTEDLYKVSLEAKNKCNTKYLDFDIQTYDKVILTLDAIPVVCGEYTFNSKSETEGLHVTGNTNNIKSINWVVYKSDDNTNGNYQVATNASYDFESGDATTLYPIIKIKESGYYKIELQAQTICNDETVSTTIEIEEPIVITLIKPDPLCANIPDEYGQNPYTLIADPVDGVWSWANAVQTEQEEYLDSTNKLFYPNKPGTYTLKYTVQRKACLSEETLDVVVKDYPTLEIGDDIYVCEKDQTPVLLEAVPNGGVWTGSEVSVDGNSYYFNPPLMVGDYDLAYTIIDEFGCKSREYKQAHIQPLPNADFGPVAHCLPDPILFTPVVDVNTHHFTLDYGDGNVGNSLSHLYDKIGIYDVKLTVTAPNGCVDSLTKSILVEKFPDQEIKVDERTGCSPFTPEITLDFDYIDPNTTLKWDFGIYGYQYTEQPTPVTFIAAERDTTYFFSVTVINVCGEYTVKDSVRVLASAQARIIPSVERGCSPLDVKFKNVSVGSIEKMKYTWDFGDGSPREYGFQASHSFVTSIDKATSYTVMFIAENNCGIDTTYQEIYVIPPVVFPQIVAKNQTGCVGEDICILNRTMEVEPHHEIITYHWDFGNGVLSDNPTDTCTVFNEPGDYTIKLTITTSCGSSETDEAKVRIYDIPKFNISAADYICKNDTVYPKVEILSDIREVEWDFGTGDYSKNLSPKYSYTTAGNHTITATATENNFAECKATKSIPLLVRELPNPRIVPLEADSCSPFTYSPVIYDEELNYTIDYENNGFRNANKQHTYINTGLELDIYQTKIYLEDKYGCKSEKHGLVTVYPQPIAGATITEVTEARPEVVTFTNTSYGANNCKWILPYSGIIETCEDVKEYYYDNVLKTTYLEVANEFGCTDKDSIDYQPMMKGLYFPNTFVPNGITEEVRTFNGVGIGIKTYRLEIYDLYGNLIYSTTSLDENGSPNEGWDGRNQAGNMMPQDVYTWKAEAVFLDGSVYTFGNDYNNVPGTEVNDATLHRGSVLLLHR